MVEVKVRKKRSKNNIDSVDLQALSVASSTDSVYVSWDKQKIIDALREVKCGKKVAEEIADAVEKTIVSSGVTNISTSLIRELVNNALFTRGHTEVLKEQGVYSVPKSTIEQLLYRKSKENSNIGNNNPGAVAMVLAGQINKQYGLDNVVSQDVKDAHLSGDIYIHDADMLSTLLYCHGASAAAVLKYGLKMDCLQNRSAPPKSAMTFIAQLNTYVCTLSQFYAGAIGLAMINTIIAPLIVDMSDKEVKQLAQYMMFSLSQNSYARGGQTVFSSIGIDNGVPDYLLDTEAIGAGGKMTGKKYREYEKEAIRFAKAVLEVTYEGDADGKILVFPKCLDKSTKMIAKVNGGMPIKGSLASFYYCACKGGVVELPSMNWTSTGDADGVKWCKVKHWCDIGEHSGLKITLNDGSKLKSTKDHKYYYYNAINKKIDVIEAKDLKIGDMLVRYVDKYYTQSIVYVPINSIEEYNVNAIAIEMDNEEHDFITGNGILTKNCDFHIGEHTWDTPERKELFEYACKVAAHNGNLYFCFDRGFASVSQCCFSGDQEVWVNGEIMNFRNAWKLHGANTVTTKHKGNTVKASIVRVPLGFNHLLRITTTLGEFVVTSDHGFIVNGENKTACSIEIGDELETYGTTEKCVVKNVWAALESDISDVDNYGNIYTYCFQMENDKEPYFTLANGVISHNCRLRSTITDKEMLKDPTRMRFTGVCVTTVSLPRCGYRSNGDVSKMYEYLDNACELAIKCTLQRKEHLKRLINTSGSPMFQMGRAFYDGKAYVDIDKGTFILGMLGLNELVQYMTGEELHESDNAMKFGLSVIARMWFLIKEASAKYGIKFVLEETPAESATRRLAKCDLRMFPESKKYIRGDEDNPYLTNSVHIRADAPVDIIERIQKQSLFHNMIESGAVVHAFVKENMPSPAAIGKLVKRTFDLTNCSQLTISPEITYCNVCGAAMLGLKDKCTKCGASDVIMSRLDSDKKTSSSVVQERIKRWERELGVQNE